MTGLARLIHEAGSCEPSPARWCSARVPLSPLRSLDEVADREFCVPVLPWLARCQPCAASAPVIVHFL